jgi:anti-sigma B factor antagonist
MLLRVDHSVAAGTADITAHGEIDLATVNTLRSAITSAIAEGARHVVLHLEGVTYIDSSGLGTLIGAHKRLASSGGTMTVRCSRPRILRLFAITGLDRVLTVTRPEDPAGLPGATVA